MLTVVTRLTRRLALPWLPVGLALALAGCNVFGGVTTVTPVPATATVAPPTAEDSAVPPATDTPPPVVPDTATAPPPASETPAVTDAPGSTDTPVPPVDPATVEVIQVLEPGQGSRVTSPVRVTGLSGPTFEQNLVIVVTDQDGAVLSTTPTTILSAMGQAGPYTQDVTFSVTAEQPGRISVYDTSARDGGLVHLSSVEVTLLPSGSASINPTLPYTEVHGITLPADLAEVSGGTLHLEGFSDYVFEATLSVALCGEGGSGAPDPLCGTTDNVIATGVALLDSPDVGLPGTYAADLAYSVAAPVQARLVVYSTSARDGGIVHLNSRNINLQP